MPNRTLILIITAEPGFYSQTTFSSFCQKAGSSARPIPSFNSSFSPSSTSGSYKLSQPRSPGRFNRPHDSQCKNRPQKPPPVSGSTDMKSDPFLLRLTYQLSHFCARGELLSCCLHTPSCSNAVLLCKPLWTSSAALSEVLSIPIGGVSLPSYRGG